MRVFPRLVLCASALLCIAGPAASQVRGPPPAGTVSSSNQQGGVTAYWIEQVNYQQIAGSDLLGRELGRVLGAQQVLHMRSSLSQQQGPSHLFLMRADNSRRARNLAYIFFSNRTGPATSRPSCSLANGVRIEGFAFDIDDTSPNSRNPFLELGRNDLALLQSICSGLARPFSTLPSQAWWTHGGARPGGSIFDFLARNGVINIVLIPENIEGRTFENHVVRYYWADVLRKRYRRVENAVAGVTVHYSHHQSATSADLFRMQISFIANLPTGRGVDVYPPEARLEFGESLGRLDAQWLAYLTQSGLTIRGSRLPLMNGNGMTEVLPRFSRAQIGSREFWLAAEDVNRSYEFVNCIAGHFLGDHGYRQEAGFIESALCERQQISYPRTSGG